MGKSCKNCATRTNCSWLINKMPDDIKCLSNEEMRLLNVGMRNRAYQCPYYEKWIGKCSKCRWFKPYNKYDIVGLCTKKHRDISQKAGCKDWEERSKNEK